MLRYLEESIREDTKSRAQVVHSMSVSECCEFVVSSGEPRAKRNYEGPCLLTYTMCIEIMYA